MEYYVGNQNKHLRIYIYIYRPRMISIKKKHLDKKFHSRSHLIFLKVNVYMCAHTLVYWKLWKNVHSKMMLVVMVDNVPILPWVGVDILATVMLGLAMWLARSNGIWAKVPSVQANALKVRVWLWFSLSLFLSAVRVGLSQDSFFSLRFRTECHVGHIPEPELIHSQTAVLQEQEGK